MMGKKIIVVMMLVLALVMAPGVTQAAWINVVDTPQGYFDFEDTVRHFVHKSGTPMTTGFIRFRPPENDVLLLQEVLIRDSDKAFIVVRSCAFYANGTPIEPCNTESKGPQSAIQGTNYHTLFSAMVNFGEPY